LVVFQTNFFGIYEIFFILLPRVDANDLYMAE
jgi:hypothetical protein